MGYTLLDSAGEPKPLRLIADRQPTPAVVGRTVWGAVPMPWAMFQVCDEVRPEYWSCEPCNRPNRRYWIQWSDTQDEFRPWWEVITSDDGPRDIEEKLAHCARVKSAQLARDAADREYRQLAGVA